MVYLCFQFEPQHPIAILHIHFIRIALNLNKRSVQKNNIIQSVNVSVCVR